MTSTQPTSFPVSPTENTERARHLGSVALFFIWAGVSILASLTWGWFLLGIGVLAVVAQLARWRMGIEIEGFWVGCGIVFLAAGIWSLLDLPWPLSAIMLIALGAVLLGRVFVAVRG